MDISFLSSLSFTNKAERIVSSKSSLVMQCPIICWNSTTRRTALWAQVHSTTRNAMNDSICGFGELIILYCRGPRRLKRNNRRDQIASFEFRV